MRTLVSLVSLVSLILLAPIAAANRAPAQRAAAPEPAAPSSSKRPAAPVANRAPAAAPAVQLPAIDLSAVPAPCKPLTQQVNAANRSVAFSARISLASCMAERAIEPLALCDCGDSIAQVDAAVAPALKVLDDVIAIADPAVQVIAEHAEGQLYAGFVIRLTATLPKVGPGAAPAEIALHDVRAQTLAVQLAPWREAALTSFQHVVELAKAHPELANNPVVATAVRDSQQRLAADVATR